MINERRALLLLIAMCWQALAWLTPLHVDHQKEVIAHIVVHAQEVGHHHHADQTLRIADDGGGAPHQHADEATQLPGLLPTLTTVAGMSAPSLQVTSAVDRHEPVFLAGLLRPPRRVASLA